MGLAQQANSPVLSSDDAQVEVGETTTVTLTAEELPDGISGYDFVASLENSDAATITDVTVPAPWPLNDTEIRDDGASAFVSSVDLNREIEEGSTDVPLAVLTIEGTANGETGIAIESPNFDAEDGSPFNFTVETGTITVGDGGEPQQPAEPANFEVSNLDAPSTVTQGETVSVSANVTNTGESEGTQTVEFGLDTNDDGSLEAIGVNESVTLDAGASDTVSFEVPTDDLEPGTYTHGVFTANDSATAQITVEAEQPEPEPEPPETTYYQVDFVAGEPLDQIGGEYPLYAEQDRLMRFAHGNTDEGITEKGSAWASEDVREAVDYGHIGMNDDGTASVTFTVADGENVTLSLAVYEKPGPGFNASETQTLLDASTETFGPGEHTITVELPDENGSDDGNATADLSAAPAALAA